jgi:hypothetical protein
MPRGELSATRTKEAQSATNHANGPETALGEVWILIPPCWSFTRKLKLGGLVPICR